MAETLMADLSDLHHASLKIKKLEERIEHMRGEMEITKDRIEICEHELSVLRNGGAKY